MILTLIEYAAMATTLLCVYLLAKERISNFYWGIAGCILYSFLFWEINLYGEMGLQLLFFLPIQIYGLYLWKNGGQNNTELEIRTLEIEELFLLVSLTAFVAFGLGMAFDSYTDNAKPYIDGFIVVTSITAQILLTKKLIETWAFWIAVDLVAIPTYVDMQIYPTAVLYTVLLILCIFGWRNWSQIRKSQLVRG